MTLSEKKRGRDKPTSISLYKEFTVNAITHADVIKLTVDMMWCDVISWCDVMWCDLVMWYDLVMWCDMMWGDVIWWYDVMVASVLATYVIVNNAIEYVEQRSFSSTGKYFKYLRNFNT